MSKKETKAVEEKLPRIKPTKLEIAVQEAIRTAKLGLPDWAAVAKQEGVTLDYINNRVDWMRRNGLIR